MNGIRNSARLFGAMVVAAGIIGMSSAQAGAAPARAAAPTPVSVASDTTAISASDISLTTVSTVTAAPLTKAAAAAKQKCWYHHSVLTAKVKGVGTKLFVFEQIVNWCGRGGKMTKVTGQQAYFSHVNNGVSVSKATSKLTKVASKYWVSRSSATAKFCIIKCVGTFHPWISATMHGNGTRSSGGGW